MLLKLKAMKGENSVPMIGQMVQRSGADNGVPHHLAITQRSWQTTPPKIASHLYHCSLCLFIVHNLSCPHHGGHPLICLYPPPIILKLSTSTKAGFFAALMTAIHSSWIRSWYREKPNKHFLNE